KDERERNIGNRVKLHQPKAANFDLAEYRRRRRQKRDVAAHVDLGVVIRNKPGAAIDQAQREIGLPRPGRSAQKDAPAVNFDGACMTSYHAQNLRQRLYFGNLIRKMAPLFTPLSSRRLLAVIVPPCASTIRREMLSPSPECRPKSSDFGRSV